MTNTNIKVKRSRKNKKSITEKYMMVESTSELLYDTFDKQIIINSLIKECDLKENEALDIANKVENILIKSDLKIITSSFIRSLTNQILSENNPDKWLKYSALTIPLYDAKSMIEDRNVENSNACFSTASINSTMGEQIHKQLAIREYFNKKSAEAHKKGECHIHDIGKFSSPYAFDGDLSIIEIKRNGIEENITIKELHKRLKTTNIKEYQILDKTGYVDLINLIELNDTKDIYEIELETGEKLFVTEDHPCLKYTMYDNKPIELQTKDLKIGDFFCVSRSKTKYNYSKIISIKKIKTVNKVYDITTSSHTLLVNNIHTHNCSGNSIEYLKKYGLRLPEISPSTPAAHANTLVNHMQCFASFLRTQFNGAIGFADVNIAFAPFLVDKSYDEIKQVAQHLIFSFAQLASGSDICFSDFNLYLDIPKHIAESNAIGPKGKPTGKKYKEYAKEAKLFLKAILEVAMAGDADGGNFRFPKLDVHIDEKSFQPENDELMDLICKLNSKRGSAYILYDRGNTVKISECCRLSLEITGEELERMIAHPEEARFSALQNCTINLPRIAYKSKKIEDIKKEIDRLVNIAINAHIDKFNHLQNVLKVKDGALKFLASGMDGKPYLRMNEAKFLIGMCGLNEMVKIISGFNLHDNEEALKLGLEIIAYLNLSMERQAKENNINCILEETPAESTAGRFALLDLKYYYDQAKHYVNGNIEKGEVYYTNSVHLAYNANVDILTRIEKQSKFASMIKAGSIIHNWFGDKEPDPKALKELYKTTLLNTNAVQTADSPDMTVCKDCHNTFKGLNDICPSCGSNNIYNTTRITGYFSQISGWTKSKLAELKDRTKVDFSMQQFENVEFNNGEQILFFQKPNCEKCETVKKQLAGKLNENVKILDTHEYKGLALASYYNVDELPCLMKVKGSQIISKLSGAGSYLKWLKDNTK